MRYQVFLFVATALVVTNGHSQEPAGRISGQVVHLQTGEPVRGTMHLMSHYNPGDIIMFSDQSTPVSDDGRFVFEQLAGQTYYLRFLPSKATWYMVNGVESVVAQSEGEAEPVKLYVDEGSAIRGQVLEADGAPYAENWVTLRPVPHYNQTTLTDETGRFFFRHVEKTGVPLTVYARDEENAIQLEPLMRGEIRRGIDLRLPPLKPTGILRGRVLLEDGRPFTGGALSVWGQDKEGASDFPEDDGTFTIEHRINGAANFGLSVDSVELALPNGETRQITFQREVIEPKQIMLAPHTEQTVEVVARELLPDRYLGAWIHDGLQTPLPALITVLDPAADAGDLNPPPPAGSDAVLDIVGFQHDKAYFVQELPDVSPLLLEITCPGYQAVVLEEGEDFELPTADLDVALKPGPFPEDYPVFTAVTGRQPGEDMPAREYIEGRIPHYVQLAQEPPRQHEDPQELRPPPVSKITVFTPDGQPATRIYHQPLVAADSSVYLMSYPDEGVVLSTATQKLAESDTGVYDIAIFDGPASYLWTEGSAYGYVGRLEDGTITEVINLKPRSAVTICVRDAQGTPVPELAVGPAVVLPPYDHYGYQMPKTNEDGCVVFDRIPPGEHVYAVVVDGTMESVQVPFRIEPGEEVTIDVLWGTPEPDSPEGLLHAFELYHQQGTLNAEVVSGIRYETRAAVARLLAERIHRMPVATRPPNYESLDFVSSLTALLDQPEPARALQELLRRARIELHLPSAIAALNPVIDTLVLQGGDDLIPFWRELAVGEAVDAGVRIQALIALARIGTEGSLAALDAIAAQASPLPNDVPSPGDALTRQLAHEYLRLFYRYPYADAAEPPPLPDLGGTNFGATTRGDDEAELSVGGRYGGTTLHFRRFDAMWRMVEIGTTVMASVP